MKKSQFSDSAIMAILKQAEAGSIVPDLCRKHGMSSGGILQMVHQVRWYGCVDDGTHEEA
jgi:hypothetical protein